MNARQRRTRRASPKGDDLFISSPLLTVTEFVDNNTRDGPGGAQRQFLVAVHWVHRRHTPACYRDCTRTLPSLLLRAGSYVRHADSVTAPRAVHPACMSSAQVIRHKDASHIFERPERLRAVLLGVAAAAARLEQAEANVKAAAAEAAAASTVQDSHPSRTIFSALLSSMSIRASTSSIPHHLDIVTPRHPVCPGQILLHHPALHLSHATPPEAPFPYLGRRYQRGAAPRAPIVAVPEGPVQVGERGALRR